MILGSKSSGSLIAVIELFLPGVGGGAVVGAVADTGGAGFACWGDCVVAGDGFGRATEDGDGGPSSTLCRFRGPESSLLRACHPSSGLELVVVPALLAFDGRSAPPPFELAALVEAVLLSSLLSIDSRSILCRLRYHGPRSGEQGIALNALWRGIDS